MDGRGEVVKWTITVRPITAAMNGWEWTAMRADEESVLSGGGATKEAALASARAHASEFEANQGAIKGATVTEEFVPEGVVVLDLPVETL